MIYIKNKDQYKIRFIRVLLVIILLFPMLSIAQSKDVDSSSYGLSNTLDVKLQDTLNFDPETKGLFNKLAKILKFRENRNNKEKQRIYEFMLELIKQNQIDVNSNAEEIRKVLDSISVANKIKRDSLSNDILKNKLSLDSIRQVVVDSFEVAFKKTLDSVFKEEMSDYFKDQFKIDSTLQLSKDLFKSIECSCSWLASQNIDIRNSTRYCIVPKVNVIGWHNYWSEQTYLNYRYKYLSVLNLYDYYELSKSGKPKYNARLKELKKSNNVAEFANRNGTDVHITVHNKYPSEISKFLNNRAAQDTLINRLVNLRDNHKINGVNIYFDYILYKDSDNFYQFIKSLYEACQDSDYSISLTIPSLYDQSSLDAVRAFQFKKLDPFIDQYIVTTDRMINYHNKWAQPTSPLYAKIKPEFGTISSTVDFYLDKISKDKLIISVSYLGMVWPVKNFGGEVQSYNRPLPYDIEYREVIRSYKKNKSLENDIESGFDSIQKVPFINYIEPNYYEPRFTKIWYEDEISLLYKYQYVLSENLSGVSIRGLGYDDGHTELWDAIGSTLMDIEDLGDRIGEEVEGKIECVKDQQSIDSISIWNKSYWLDILGEHQTTDQKVDSLSFFKRILDDLEWAQQPKLYYKGADYDEDNLQKVEVYLDEDANPIPILNDKESCICLYDRLEFYSKISLNIALFLFVIIALMGFRIRYLQNFKQGNNAIVKNLKIVSLILMVILILLVLFGLYMATWFEYFGASNTGKNDIIITVLISFVGILVGLYAASFINRGKYVAKDLP